MVTVSIPGIIVSRHLLRNCLTAFDGVPYDGACLNWDPTLPGVGTNRYAYAHNDPINKSDPNGHSTEGDPSDDDQLGANGDQGAEPENEEEQEAVDGIKKAAGIEEEESKAKEVQVAANRGNFLPGNRFSNRQKYNLSGKPVDGPRSTNAEALPAGRYSTNTTTNVPPNLTPPNAGRRGAFRESKRNSGIPVSQQPAKTTPNYDKRGKVQPGRQYHFDNPKTGARTTIRDDSGGHFYGPSNPQNRGPHFNDPKGRHYDY